MLEKKKIGEIYQVSPQNICFICLHCTGEFAEFAQFTEHIQRHLLDIKSSTIDQPLHPNVNCFEEVDVDVKPIIDCQPIVCDTNGQFTEYVEVKYEITDDGSKISKGMQMR